MKDEVFAVIIGVGTQAQVGLHMGGGDYVGAKRALWSGATTPTTISRRLPSLRVTSGRLMLTIT